jgi:hypothetical protein
MTEEEIKEAKAAEHERRTIAVETAGLHAAFAALQPLDYHARCRALHWLRDALDNREEPPF